VCCRNCRLAERNDVDRVSVTIVFSPPTHLTDAQNIQRISNDDKLYLDHSPIPIVLVLASRVAYRTRIALLESKELLLWFWNCLSSQNSHGRQLSFFSSLQILHSHCQVNERKVGVLLRHDRKGGWAGWIS
jgi:hypothetical protein